MNQFFSAREAEATNNEVIPPFDLFPVRPPGDPKMCENCRTICNFTVFALPGTSLGSMWPPWLPHGAKCDPFGAPKPSLGERNGRHSDPLGCPWSHPGSPRVPNLIQLVAKCRHSGTQMVPHGSPRGTQAQKNTFDDVFKMIKNSKLPRQNVCNHPGAAEAMKL